MAKANSGLKIITLNVRGLREIKKRRDFFFWLKEKKYDICMLQETYWTNELTSKLKKEWEGDILLNYGSQHSKGTAILFRNRHDIVNVHKSEDSRIILSNIKLEDETLTIVNIYAPNNATERKAFFGKVQKWIEKFALNESKIIIGGDFNFAENHSLDRSSHNNIKDISAISYKNLIKEINLHDVWRQMHPNRKQFTYKEISRLDKFLLSTSLIDSVQKANISIPGIRSDHKCVSIYLDFDKSEKGPGNWKMNISNLNDRCYQAKIKSLLQKTQNEYKNLSKQLVWEICKIKIKEFTVSYCKFKQQIKKKLMRDLENKIQNKETELINSNYCSTVQAERDSLIRELHLMVHEQSLGAQIRSRAKWIEQGEKSTKYFFNLEKEHYTKNTIKKLKRNDGSYTKTDGEIIEEGFHFYKSLYSKEQVNKKNIQSYLKETDNLKTLNKNDQKCLEGKLTIEECEEALKNMKNNKSPGSDGLPVEFYKTFWNDIKSILIESLNYAYEVGELSPTQKRGILTLLFKKNDKYLLKNWRPISLLNTDYKILARVLADRLKCVINKIIHTDQNGYIKGRSIGYNIRLIQDVIEYFENDNIEGAIIFLDFHKAFDTVNHTFLHLVLEKFNFGNSFIKWVKTMYCKAESCLSNNGWTSRPFEIQRGIRQGCPLSALLFLLVVEILASRIRKSTNDGLQIKVQDENKYIQLTQLADDTTVFLKNEQAVKNCLNIVEYFGKFSGLKLNLEKTEGLWLGKGRNRNDEFAGINWRRSYIKALGVYFGYNKQEVEDLNWKSKLEVIKKILNKWKYRELTFQGRILIIKTLALSQVVYLTSSLCTPIWVINEINKEFYSFVWKYKRDKISRKVLINELDAGGIRMIDFKTFCVAMKAVWATRLYKSKNETWTIIPNKYMESCGINIWLQMNIDKEKLLPLKLPRFYSEVILSWRSCGGGLKAPQNEAEIRQQIIWGNKYIQTKGKTIFYKNWHKSNINFIDDLLDKTGNFKTGQEIFSSLERFSRANWLIEYNTIIKSIPTFWKDKLKNTNMGIKVKKDLKPSLFNGNKYIFELPSKAKGFYEILIRRTRERSYIEKFWDKIFPNKPLWTEIWNSRVKAQTNKQLADFHFKLIHKILPSQENLYKWKISNSNLCRFGCDAIESYDQMFISCPRLRQIYSKLEKSFQNIGINIKLTYKTLLFGYKAIYPAYKAFNTLLSHIFFAVYLLWLQNSANTDVGCWLFNYINLGKKIYQELNDLKTCKLFEEVLREWEK